MTTNSYLTDTLKTSEITKINSLVYDKRPPIKWQIPEEKIKGLAEKQSYPQRENNLIMH